MTGTQSNADVSKARVYIRWKSGRFEVQEYTDEPLAYSVWLALGKGVRAAFRGANDKRPVYSWDYVDRL